MSVFLLDCDGVLADFVGHMLAELRAHGRNDVPDDAHEYDFLRGFSERTSHVARDLLKRGEHWHSIQPYPEARAGVDEIRRCGHDVVVVTSPWLSCREWAHVRREWLERHFDIKHRDLIVTSRKELVVGDAFIDDRAETVAAWEAKHPYAAARLMHRTWTIKDDIRLTRFSWTPESLDALLGEVGVTTEKPRSER